MKKIKVLLGVLLALLVLQCNVLDAFAYSSYNPQYNPDYSGIAYTQVSDTDLFVNNTICKTGCINAISIIREHMPQTVMLLCWQEGVRLYYTEGAVPLYQRGFNAMTSGPIVNYDPTTYRVTSVTKHPYIYIYDDMQDWTTIAHEYGHAFDMIAGYITGYYSGAHGFSETQTWQQIYYAELNMLCRFDDASRTIALQGPVEGFAEAFRIYSLAPDTLRTYMPLMYSYIDTQVKNFAVYVKELTPENFDYDYYLEEYPDVQAAYGDNKELIWAHFANCGAAEGRMGRKRFPL